MFHYPSWGTHVQMLNNKPYLALCWASPATAVCISGSAGKVWPADLSDSASESLAPGACPGHSYTLSYLATSPPYLLYLTTWQQDTYLKKSVKSWLGRPGDFDRIVCSFDISDESGVRIDKRLLSELKTNWVQISYEQVLYLLSYNLWIMNLQNLIEYFCTNINVNIQNSRYVEEKCVF